MGRKVGDGSMSDEFEAEYIDFDPTPFPLAEFEEIEVDSADLYDTMLQLEAQQELENRFENLTDGMSIEELTNFKNSLLDGDEMLYEYLDCSQGDVSDDEGFQKVYK